MEKHISRLTVLSCMIAGLYLAAFYTFQLSTSLPAIGVSLKESGLFNGSVNSIWAVQLAFLATLLLFRNNKVKKQTIILDRKSKVIDGQAQAISAHSIVSVTDPQAKIIEVNEKFEKAFGYTSAEVIGRNHSFLYPTTNGTSQVSKISSRLKSGKTWSGQERLLAKDNSILIVQSTSLPIFDENGKHVRTIELRTDVTKQRRSESEKNLASIMDTMPEEIYVYDPDNLNVLYVNKKARARLGWTRRIALKSHIQEAGNVFAEMLTPSLLETVKSGKEPETCAEALLDGTPVELITRLNHGLDGEPVLVTFVRDISERKHAEELKLQSVSMVSHELRTPLTSIKGALGLLKSGVMGPLSANVNNIVEIAERNSNRLLLVVNDILDIEKLNSGKMEFFPQTVDLNSFLQEATMANNGYAVECGIEFVLTEPPAGSTLHADSDRMMQVMSNLMSNAAKFSPKGGKVTISVKDMGKMLRVSVSDKGPGIPQESHEKLFDLFVQAKPVAGKKVDGTGLGLAIAKKIVEMHGGSIGFETGPQSGTTFYFDLPKAGHAPKVAEIHAFATAAE